METVYNSRLGGDKYEFKVGDWVKKIEDRQNTIIYQILHINEKEGTATLSNNNDYSLTEIVPTLPFYGKPIPPHYKIGENVFTEGKLEKIVGYQWNNFQFRFEYLTNDGMGGPVHYIDSYAWNIKPENPMTPIYHVNDYIQKLDTKGDYFLIIGIREYYYVCANLEKYTNEEIGEQILVHFMEAVEYTVLKVGDWVYPKDKGAKKYLEILKIEKSTCLLSDGFKCKYDNLIKSTIKIPNHRYKIGDKLIEIGGGEGIVSGYCYYTSEGLFRYKIETENGPTVTHGENWLLVENELQKTEIDFLSVKYNSISQEPEYQKYHDFFEKFLKNLRTTSNGFWRDKDWRIQKNWIFNDDPLLNRCEKDCRRAFLEYSEQHRINVGALIKDKAKVVGYINVYKGQFLIHEGSPANSRPSGINKAFYNTMQEAVAAATNYFTNDYVPTVKNKDLKVTWEHGCKFEMSDSEIEETIQIWWNRYKHPDIYPNFDGLGAVSTTEAVFNVDSENYDTRKGNNLKPELTIPKDIIDTINKGLTIEQIDLLTKKGFPVCKYKTQITIHGMCPELDSNYTIRYSTLQRNQNGSLGVRWRAIDEKKKYKLHSEYLSYFGFHKTDDSKGIYFSKSIECQDQAKVAPMLEQLRAKYQAVMDKKLFFGNISISKPTFSYFIIPYFTIYLNIDGIYEKNIIPFVEALIGKPISEINKEITEIKRKWEEENRKREEERKKRQAEYAKKEAEIEAKKQKLIAENPYPPEYQKVGKLQKGDIVIEHRIRKDYETEELTHEWDYYLVYAAFGKLRMKPCDANGTGNGTGHEITSTGPWMVKRAVSAYTPKPAAAPGAKPTVTSNGPTDFKILKYTDKYYILVGDTKPYSKILGKHPGGMYLKFRTNWVNSKYDPIPNGTGWGFSSDKKAAVEAFIAKYQKTSTPSQPARDAEQEERTVFEVGDWVCLRDEYLANDFRTKEKSFHRWYYKITEVEDLGIGEPQYRLSCTPYDYKDEKIPLFIGHNKLRRWNDLSVMLSPDYDLGDSLPILFQYGYVLMTVGGYYYEDHTGIMYDTKYGPLAEDEFNGLQKAELEFLNCTLSGLPTKKGLPYGVAKIYDEVDIMY